MVTWLYILDCSYQYGNTDYRKMKCCCAKIFEPIDITSTRAVALEWFRNSGIKSYANKKQRKHQSCQSLKHLFWFQAIVFFRWVFSERLVQQNCFQVVRSNEGKIRIKTSHDGQHSSTIRPVIQKSRMINPAKKSTSWSRCFL